MFGVIWGHTITNLLAGADNSIMIHRIMRTYDMPLFMVISGYFLAFSLSKKSLIESLKDKVSGILLPVVIWDLIITYGRSLGSLYFLWAVFFSSLLVTFVAKMVRDNRIRMTIFVLITVILNFIPVTLCNMSYLFPFFAAGYLVNEMKVSVSKLGGALSLQVFVILLCFWKSEYNIWNTGTYFKCFNSDSLGIVVFRYAIGVVGCVVFVWFFNMLYQYYEKHRTWLFDFICISGKETLAIYILQDIVLFKFLKHGVLVLSNHLGYNPFLWNETFMGYVIATVLAFIVLFLIYKLAILVKSWRYTKYIFGGKIASWQSVN